MRGCERAFLFPGHSRRLRFRAEGVTAASGSFDTLILTLLCVDRVKNLQTIAPRRQRSTTFASP